MKKEYIQPAIECQAVKTMGAFSLSLSIGGEDGDNNYANSPMLGDEVIWWE